REALGEQGPVALDGVLELEACAAHVEAAGMHDEPIVEPRRADEAHVRLDEQRLDSLVAEPLVTAREPLEKLDPGELEPDQVVRVVDDALGVRLREADADVGSVLEPLHAFHFVRATARAVRDPRIRTARPRPTAAAPDGRATHGRAASTRARR